MFDGFAADPSLYRALLPSFIHSLPARPRRRGCCLAHSHTHTLSSPLRQTTRTPRRLTAASVDRLTLTTATRQQLPAVALLLQTNIRLLQPTSVLASQQAAPFASRHSRDLRQSGNEPPRLGPLGVVLLSLPSTLSPSLARRIVTERQTRRQHRLHQVALLRPLPSPRPQK